MFNSQFRLANYRVQYLLLTTMYYQTLNLFDCRKNQLTFSRICSTNNTKTNYSKLEESASSFLGDMA